MITCFTGKRAAASVIFPLAALLLCAPPGFAVPVPWLYDVDIAVAGRTGAARLAVSGTALAEVLSRVSGLAHVPRNAAVREALGQPERYYNRFVFLNDRELRIHFDPAAVLGLVDAAGLPVWSANRPTVVAWLVVERGGVRRVVDGGHELAVPLVRRARQRGVVLKLPLMDLEDRLLVQPSVVWGRLFSALSEASGRYQADVVLVGRLQEQVCAPDPWVAVDLDTVGALDPDGPDGPDGNNADARVPPAAASPMWDTARAPGPGGNDAEVRTPPVAASSVSDTARALDPGGSDAEARASPVATSPVSDTARPGSSPAVESSSAASPAIATPLGGSTAACGSAGASIYGGSLEAWMDGEEFALAFTAGDVREGVRMAVDFVADELAGRFAVLARVPNRIALTIGGIHSPVGYGRLLGYLDALEFVTAVDVVAVRDDRLEVALHTRAGLDQLVELFHRDGRIRRDPANAALLTWQGP